MSALPEHVSTVSVSDTVDGSARRKATGARRRLATPVEMTTVDRRALAAMRAALRPGERLVIRGGVVRTEYR